MKPKGHKENCNCTVCYEIRHKGEKNAHVLKEFKALRQYYDIRRNGRLSIFGWAMGAYSAFFQWILQYASFKKLTHQITHLPYKSIYTLPHVSDGAALLLIGWLMWGYWALASVFIGIVLSILIGLSLTIIGKYIVFSLPYPIIAVLEIIFFFPASVLNRDLGKRDASKYRSDREWGNPRQNTYARHQLDWIAIFLTCIPVLGWIGAFCYIIGNGWEAWFYKQ